MGMGWGWHSSRCVSLVVWPLTLRYATHEVAHRYLSHCSAYCSARWTTTRHRCQQHIALSTDKNAGQHNVREKNARRRGVTLGQNWEYHSEMLFLSLAVLNDTPTVLGCGLALLTPVPSQVWTDGILQELEEDHDQNKLLIMRRTDTSRDSENWHYFQRWSLCVSLCLNKRKLSLKTRLEQWTAISVAASGVCLYLYVSLSQRNLVRTIALQLFEMQTWNLADV